MNFNIFYLLSSSLDWLLLLVLLATIGVWVSVALLQRRELKKSGWLSGNRSLINLSASDLQSQKAEIQDEMTAAALIAVAAKRMERQTRSAAGKLLIALLIGMSIGVAGGYGGRDLQTFYFTKPFSNVLVVERHNAKEFTLYPDAGQLFEVTMCDPQDWQPGEKMDFFSYEQKPGCKNLRGHLLGAHFYNVHGNRVRFPIPHKEIANAR